MNYLKHYIKLIRKRQSNSIENGEKHHIFPQSLFGKNKNVVRLTIREHFVAHKLLYKACEKRYGKKHNKTIRMLFALRYMMLDNRNNGSRKETSMVVSSKLLVDIRSIHPSMIEGVGEKISKSKKGVPVPLLQGDNNPSKNPSVRIKISKSKIGKERNDLKGKRYFGASEENIILGIEKMRNKKIGMEINYPQNRKSVPCSVEKAKKISESRSKTKENFITMTNSDFEEWIGAQKMYRKDGKKNPNVTRVLVWRGIPIEQYYPKE